MGGAADVSKDHGDLHAANQEACLRAVRVPNVGSVALLSVSQADALTFLCANVCIGGRPHTNLRGNI